MHVSASKQDAVRQPAAASHFTIPTHLLVVHRACCRIYFTPTCIAPAGGAVDGGERAGQAGVGADLNKL